MLFKDIKEIKAYLPTSKWAAEDFNMLQDLLYEEEQTLCNNHLGPALHNKLCEDYWTLNEEYGGIIEANESDESTTALVDEELTVRILRDCQRIILYRMLANNAGILSMSFNKGGGINVMTSGEYDSASEQAVERYKKDCWNKTIRNIDTLLIHLEDDAQHEAVYTELWKQSRYFYLHKDLLFSTATELQMYLDIKSNREKYIELIPTLRHVQSAYIIDMIGDDLLQYIIDKRYKDDSTDEIPTPPNASILKRVTDEILMSASQYMKAATVSTDTTTTTGSVQRMNRDAHEYRDNGALHIALAVKHVINNADEFDQFITDGSPLAHAYKEAFGKDYIPKNERDNNTIVTDAIRKVKHEYDRHNPCNAVFDLGGTLRNHNKA